MIKKTISNIWMNSEYNNRRKQAFRRENIHNFILYPGNYQNHQNAMAASENNFVNTIQNIDEERNISYCKKLFRKEIS